MVPSYIELAKDYGPAVLSVIASVMSGLFSVGLWLAQMAWRKHKKQMLSLAKSIEAIGTEQKSIIDLSRKEHAKLWEMTATLRAELHLSNQKSDTIKAGLLGLEGTMRQQTTRIDTYIERMGQAEGKFAAIFKFLDAKPRATDV